MTLKDFVAGIADYRFQVLHDYGLYRHISLHITWQDKQAISIDIATTPRLLAVRGDTGYYAFSQGLDVFSYFRQMDTHTGINPNHWERILLSGNARRWCPHYARECIADAFNQWAQQHSCPKFIGGQLARLNNELKLFADDEHEFIKLLRGWIPDSPGILIHDLIDTNDLKRHSPDFLFTCNAIAWAISKFDDIKQQARRVDNQPIVKRRVKPLTKYYAATGNNEGN